MLCLLLVIKPNNIVFHRSFILISLLSIFLSQAGTDIALAAVNSDGRGGVTDR